MTVTLLFWAIGVASVRAQTPGSLDTSFNPGSGAGGTNPGVNVATVQNDGKVILGGTFDTVNGVGRNHIARLNADGSVDIGFDPGSGADSQINRAVVQSDGRIVIGGNFTTINGVGRNHIARLNANGSLDTSFNPGSGVARASSPTVNAVILQGDGKIVIGGVFDMFNGVARSGIARLNADGSLDTSFNPGMGIGGATPFVYTAALQGDGKVVLGGNFTTVNGVTRNRLARLNADGSLDTGFDPGSGADNQVYTVVLQSDGSILVSGFFTTFNGAAHNRLVRLNANGSLDTGFDPGTGANSDIFGMTLQSDGKVVLGGNFTTVNGVTRKRLARLNFDGSVDVGFDPGASANNQVYIVAVQLDGKIVVSGLFSSFNGVARNGILRLYGGDAAPSPKITSSTSASGQVGQTFRYQLTANNQPVSYAASGLPAGLNMDTSSGLISGVLGAAGTFTVSLQATGAGNSVAIGTLTLVVTLAAAPVITGINPNPVTGSNDPQTIMVTGSGFTSGMTALVTWSKGSATLSDASKIVVDSATQARIFITTQVHADTWTIKVTNTAPDSQSSNAFSFQVVAPPPTPVVTSSTTYAGIAGRRLSYQITANNRPVNFTASGLPSGLALDAGSGIISGVPQTVGTYNVALTATGAATTTASGTLELTVSQTFVLPPTSSPPVLTFPPQPLSSGLSPFLAAYGSAFPTTTQATLLNQQSLLDKLINPGQGSFLKKAAAGVNQAIMVGNAALALADATSVTNTLDALKNAILPFAGIAAGDNAELIRLYSR